MEASRRRQPPYPRIELRIGAGVPYPRLIKMHIIRKQTDIAMGILGTRAYGGDEDERAGRKAYPHRIPPYLGFSEIMNLSPPYTL